MTHFSKTWLLALWVAGCAKDEPCREAALAPLPASARYAAIHSDYNTTAVSILGASGEYLSESWIDSGSTQPGLRTTLGGDVVFAGQAPRGEMVVLDRWGTDVVTRMGIPSGDVLAQWPVGNFEGQHFRANPYDAMRMDENKWLITRHEPNLDPAATENARGNDLIVLSGEGALLQRIGLEGSNSSVDGVTVFARPARIVAVEQGWAISLTRLSRDFSKADEGQVVILNRERQIKGVLELEGLANCTELATAPNSLWVLWVLCSGQTFAEEAVRRESAGLAKIIFSAEGAAQIENLWRAQEHPELSVPTNGLIVVSESQIMVVAYGDERIGKGDVLLWIDSSANTAETLLQVAKAFSLGSGVYDAEQAQVLIPDTEHGFQRLSVTGQSPPEALSPISGSTCHGLPARALSRIDS